ncbi:MAG: GSCFA domain-containing protein [Bacteroidota bacterium]
MKLYAQVPLEKGQQPIDYQSKVLLLGSCFAENMGKKLNYFKFEIQQNPFGILFHPLAIERFLERVVTQKSYTESDVFQHNAIWHCFDAHSRLSSPSKEELLEKLNSTLQRTRAFLEEASHVCITLGTAWVYQHKKNDQTVANCHKVPQTEFEKNLLSPKALIKSLERMVSLLRGMDSSPQLLFTISPVRHLKDGFVENQRSKGHLIHALHHLLEQNTNRDIAYFPAYEIVMDELRDYRFYEKDLVHPNALAIDYLWEKFTETWVSEAAKGTMKEIDGIQKGLAHRPQNPNSEANSAMQKQLAVKIEYLQERYPRIKFDS